MATYSNEQSRRFHLHSHLLNLLDERVQMHIAQGTSRPKKYTPKSIINSDLSISVLNDQTNSSAGRQCRE